MIVKGAFPNIEVHLSAGKGDVFRAVVRNGDPNDVPLAICYNLGTDFALLTPHEQRARVRAMAKILRFGVAEVAESMGGLIGVKSPKIPPSTETGGGSANIRSHSMESFWSMGHRRGGGPFVQGGLPSLGKRS
jgi:hypothetical protein